MTEPEHEQSNTELEGDLEEPVYLDPEDWPPPRAGYPGDDSEEVGHDPLGDNWPETPEDGEGGAEESTVVIPCSDYSLRGRRRIVAAIFHTAEGATNVRDLGNYFRTTSRYVSSHVGIDAAGRLGRYVPDRFAAWTNPDVNDYSVTAELCVFARWTEAQWLDAPLLLERAARWAAQVHRDHGVPLRWISPTQLNRAVGLNDPSAGGFCEHYTVTVARNRVGGHTDCGLGFRGDVKEIILKRAREIAYPTEPPKETPEMPPTCANGEVPVSQGGHAWTWAEWFRKYSKPVLALSDRAAKLEAKVTELEADNVALAARVSALEGTPESGAPA